MMAARQLWAHTRAAARAATATARHVSSHSLATGATCTAGALGLGALYAPRSATCQDARTYTFTFGWGLHGQLGLGDDDNRAVPEEVEDVSDEHVVQVAAAGNSIAILTSEGAVFTCGQGQHGRLGHGSASDQESKNGPVEVPLEGVVQVACAATHMAAVTKDGALYAWGHARNVGLQPPHGRAAQHVFSPLCIVPGGVASVDVGMSHTALVTTDGKLKTFGDGAKRQLGHGDGPQAKQVLLDLDEGLTQPLEVHLPATSKDNNAKVVQAACGTDFTIALTDQGQVFTFGSDDHGQCGGGGGGGRYKSTPVHVKKLRKHNVVAIAAGEFHAVAVTDQGVMFTWGCGSEGQLGHGNDNDVSTPREVEHFKGQTIRHVACGAGHTAAVDSAGKLYMFGRGRNGQLGRGNHVESVAFYTTTPKQVDTLDDYTVTAVALGTDNTVVLAVKP